MSVIEIRIVPTARMNCQNHARTPFVQKVVDGNALTSQNV